MIRNLIAAIFLLALALPACAVPVPARTMNAYTAVTTMAAGCHGMPIKQPRKYPGDHGSMQQHGCIGCIAPFAPAMEIGRAEALPLVVGADFIRKLEGTAPPPNTPPPRA